MRHTNKEIQLISTIQRLEEKIRNQKHTLKWQNEALRQKNLELEAYHHVWCTGSCESGIHRFTEQPPVTLELVKVAVRNTRRLVTRYHNDLYKELQKKPLEDPMSESEMFASYVKRNLILSAQVVSLKKVSRKWKQLAKRYKEKLSAK